MANQFVERDVRTYLAAGEKRGLERSCLVYRMNISRGDYRGYIHYISQPNHDGDQMRWRFGIEFGDLTDLSDATLYDPIDLALPKNARYGPYRFEMISIGKPIEEGPLKGFHSESGIVKISFSELTGEVNGLDVSALPRYAHLLKLKNTGESNKENLKLPSLLIEQTMDLWVQGIPASLKKERGRKPKA